MCNSIRLQGGEWTTSILNKSRVEKMLSCVGVHIWLLSYCNCDTCDISQYNQLSLEQWSYNHQHNTTSGWMSTHTHNIWSPDFLNITYMSQSYGEHEGWRTAEMKINNHRESWHRRKREWERRGEEEKKKKGGEGNLLDVKPAWHN